MKSQKLLSELKTDEVFDWFSMGGKWRLASIDSNSKMRDKTGNFIVFWFEDINSPGHNAVPWIKGVDKDEKVDIIVGRE